MNTGTKAATVSSNLSLPMYGAAGFYVREADDLRMRRAPKKTLKIESEFRRELHHLLTACLPPTEDALQPATQCCGSPP